MTQIHRSLTRPVLLGGAERAPAIINATTMLGIGLGPGFHWPNILLAIFLGTAVHMLLRWMAKRDPQFFVVYLRHLSYCTCCCAGWRSAILNSSWFIFATLVISRTTGIFPTRTCRQHASIVR
jgi:type IV secretion system protein VirB3